MAICYINKSDSISVYVWEITEDIDLLYKKAELTNGEAERYSTFGSESRKRQWLAVRACLNKVFGRKVFVSYDVDGRPSINDESDYISISHADNFVAIAVCANLFVGVDIESISRNYKKISTKFLDEEEISIFVAKRFNEKLFYPIIWCAKEAAFKAGFKCEVDFVRDIRIREVESDDKFSVGSVVVEFLPIAKVGKFKFSTLNNHVLVWGEYGNIQ